MSQSSFVGALTCPATEGEQSKHGFAHQLTPDDPHIHKLTLPWFSGIDLADAHLRGWSFPISVWISPHYSAAEVNIQSVMELQFTWAHTFQLIQTSAHWLTCEQSLRRAVGYEDALLQHTIPTVSPATVSQFYLLQCNLTSTFAILVTVATVVCFLRHMHGWSTQM